MDDIFKQSARSRVPNPAELSQGDPCLNEWRSVISRMATNIRAQPLARERPWVIPVFVTAPICPWRSRAASSPTRTIACLWAGHGVSVLASRTCGCERSVNFVCTSAPGITSLENQPGQPDWRIPQRPSWSYPSTEFVNGSWDLSQEPRHVLSTPASNIHPSR